MRNSYRNKYYSFMLLVPGILIYFIFFILPTFMGTYYSFTNWDFISASFVGLQNYINILTDSSTSGALKNTVIFAIVTTISKVLIGMLLAVFLNRQLKTRNYLRTVFYLPAVINTIAVGIMFTAILHPTEGILNVFFHKAGLGFLAQDWLTNTKIALFSICAIETWKWSGFNMVIILVGLQSISNEYMEAADIDGANSRQKFWKITFPLIMPAFNNAFVSSLIGGLKVFDIVVATTNGGPGSATQVMNTIIYRSFAFNMQGEANAGAVLLGVIVAAFAVVSYTFIRKREVEL